MTNAIATTDAEPQERVVLPNIREAKTWDKASAALLKALEREEGEALAALEVAKARAQKARRAAAAMRRVRDVVILNGAEPERSRQVVTVAPESVQVSSATTLPDAPRWCQAYACCRECRRTEVRHAARGLCFTCYSRAMKSAQGS